MNRPSEVFGLLPRLLHWAMAALIIAMLFIGVGMVGSVSATHEILIRLHKPLGVLILLLALLRLGIRMLRRPPALPEDLPQLQKHAAHASHVLLYVLMIAMPLVGWAMLSAAGDPIMLNASIRLPAIFPVSTVAYAYLRQAHTVLAMLFFIVILGHVDAALYHALIRRDGVLRSMLGKKRR